MYDVDGNIVEEHLLDREGNPIVMLENENSEETEEEKIERELELSGRSSVSNWRPILSI